jgi:hypothetical protein
MMRPWGAGRAVRSGRARGASLGVLGVLACYGVDRLLAGYQQARVLPPDQGCDPANMTRGWVGGKLRGSQRA